MSKDAGHDETEKVLKEIEKRISREYKQAEKEVAAKLDDYLKKFETKDKTWQKWVADGTKTQKEYDQWRVGQICMGQRWDEQRKTLAQDFAKSSQIAKDITASKMPDVYAINHNYATFQIEQASMINTSYTLYDHKTVERLAKGDDKIIPVPGKKISRLIDEGKAVKWNERQIQSVMMQSLLQGESIPDIASRLAYSVGDSDRKASVRNARTLTTGVQNAGRVDSYERANEMGIQTAKQWIAALDDRTRHWHAELDGEIVENDEPFENEYGKIMYPGDPLADPANIYNCRCTLIAAIKGFDKGLSDRYDEKLGKMSYSQWKASKKSSSDDIEKQYKKSLKFRSESIKEYTNDKSFKNDESGFSDAFMKNADPLYDEFGSMKDSHPELMQSFIEEAKNKNVEIKSGTSSMAYSPGLKRGNPGQLFVSENDSIGAWCHEMQHMRDDEKDGWAGFAGLTDIDRRARMEYNAYKEEIKIAKEAGRKDLVKQLVELCKEEIKRIGGDWDESRLE